MEDDPLPGLPPVLVGGGAVKTDRAAAAAPRVAPLQVGLQRRIALPDQALALTLGGARGQLLLEADHHPQQEAAALAIAGDAVAPPVLAPQPLAGLQHEAVDVAGAVEGGAGPAQLQHP